MDEPTDDFFQKTVCPIWFKDERGGFEVEGSGLLLTAGSFYFLITAAHTMDRCEQQTAYIGLEIGFVEMTGPMEMTIAPNGQRSQDRVDICVQQIPVTTAELIKQGYCFLPFVFADVLDPGEVNTPYIVSGFPWRKVQREGKEMVPEFYDLRVTGLALEAYHAMDLSVESHIAMSFQRQKMADEGGRRIMAPHPEGMSGGPVWKYYKAENDQRKTRRLVGIITDYDSSSSALVATRFSAAIHCMAKVCPEFLFHTLPPTGAIKTPRVG